MTVETEAQRRWIASRECPLCGCIIINFGHDPECADMARSELARYWRKYGRPRNALEWIQWEREGEQT